MSDRDLELRFGDMNGMPSEVAAAAHASSPSTWPMPHMAHALKKSGADVAWPRILASSATELTSTRTRGRIQIRLNASSFSWYVNSSQAPEE